MLDANLGLLLHGEVSVMDLPVMRKCLGQKWQNNNFGDKTVLKNLFSLDFSKLHVIVGCIKPRIQKQKV